MADNTQDQILVSRKDLKAILERLMMVGYEIFPPENPSIDQALVRYAACSDEINLGKLRLCIAAGADVDTRSTYGAHGVTALHLAATFGNNEGIKLLLAAKADTGLTDREDGLTALEMAILNNRKESAALLEPATAVPVNPKLLESVRAKIAYESMHFK